MTEFPCLHIRRYRREDHDVVWALHNQALDAVAAHGGNGPWDDDLHKIEQTYLAVGGEFLVGEINGLVIVMGALRPLADQATGRHAEIKRMRVHPDFWRHGYGRAMLRALESRAADLGFAILHLDTTARQTAAQTLYRQAGYCEVGRHTWHEYTVIDFEKELG